MLERSQRPFDDEDRRVLEQYRENSIGTTEFVKKFTFFAGTAGLVLGLLWMGIFHFGDRGAPLWPIFALAAAGAAFGFPFDYLRHRTERQAREALAAAKWDPIIAVGLVEHVVAEAEAAVRLDDHEGNMAWFLQVGEKQILCVWEWAGDATERVAIDLVPGNPPTPLRTTWTGEKLVPLRPKRKFKRGEREPEECEMLDGTLDELDGLLRAKAATKRLKKRATKARAQGTLPPSSKLADDVESLGFYKYVAADQIEEIKSEIENGAHDWFLAAGRAFDGDAERLAEGGVKDLLDYMRPALAVEGFDVADIEQSYDAEQGYTLRVGAERLTMWGEGEGRQSWELTTERTLELINAWLTKARSEERVHVLNGGEDAIFVLLTPAMHQAIVRSGAFESRDIPAPSEPRR